VPNHEVSLLENLIDVNPNLSITEAYTILARYKFRDITAHRKVADLSSGEKVRAALAILLNTQTVPQLLILDEPTNHLDVESIELLEQALNCYKGAILVVSHDFHFLKNINIDREVCV
jgi:ATPase subunit of ABC transporter with duplicated ATPase domains